MNNFFNSNNLILSVKEKKEFFNSFYFLYKSGLSLVEIFKSISETSGNLKIKNLAFLILKKLEKGSSLNEALVKYKNAINPAYTMLICAGEKSGKLEDVLLSIINNLSKEEQIRSNLISSVTYPSFIFCFAISVFLFFKFFVFKIFELLEEGELKQNIIPILLFSAIVKILFFLVILACIVIYIAKHENIKNKFIDLIMNIGFLKNIIKNYYFQSFFTIMSLSYKAGVPVTESLELSNAVIKLESINTKINQAVEKLYKGSDLTLTLKQCDVFTDFAISQISAGEKAGELDKTLEIVANDYENKFDSSVKMILKLVEPITIIFVGLMVLYIAVSLYNKYFSSLFSML